MKFRGNRLIYIFFQLHGALIFSENFICYNCLQKLASAYFQQLDSDYSVTNVFSIKRFLVTKTVKINDAQYVASKESLFYKIFLTRSKRKHK